MPAINQSPRRPPRPEDSLNQVLILRPSPTGELECLSESPAERGCNHATLLFRELDFLLRRGIEPAELAGAEALNLVNGELDTTVPLKPELVQFAVEQFKRNTVT